MDRAIAVKNSALWAAYGDAVGFISELADQANLFQRAGVEIVSSTFPWKRRIGGRFGITVELPAGCYSDDTQLRLAVSRSINGHGFFDVEALAKVELPLWLNYALGAGSGSKAAASNLTKKNVTWATNFFLHNSIDYLNTGGNGAAMRIQPHVWSFKKGQDLKILLRDIIRDAVLTHGHPRGILGAVFHGLCVLYALDRGLIPTPKDWDTFLRRMEDAGSILANDDQLSYLWLPEWQKRSGKQFNNECLSVIKEFKEDIEKLAPYLEKRSSIQYKEMVSAIDGFNPSCRGSGVKTVLLASSLAFLYGEDVEGAILASANTLGSDTDTIGTMAGAIIGATIKNSPQGILADQEYIVSEAERMFQISQGKECLSFVYPDLLKWDPPMNQLDSLVMTAFGLIFSAFGKVTPDSNEYHQESKYPATWRWYRSSFGQRFLIKHRKQIKQDRTLPEPSTGYYKFIEKIQKQSASQKQLSFDIKSPNNSHYVHKITTDDAFEEVRKSNFSPDIIGKMLLRIVDSDDNIDRAIAFAGLVSKARQEQQKRSRN